MDHKIHKMLLRHPNRGIRMAMDAYGGLCWSIIYGKLHTIASREDMEECMSDVFTDFYKNRNHIDLSKGTLKAYLAQIAFHKSADYYHKLLHQQIHESSLETYPIQTACDIPSDTFNRQILMEALRELGEPDYTIFLWKYFFGYSSKEIGEKLQMKPNTIDQKISRGLKKLKLIMEGGASHEN